MFKYNALRALSRVSKNRHKPSAVRMLDTESTPFHILIFLLASVHGSVWRGAVFRSYISGILTASGLFLFLTDYRAVGSGLVVEEVGDTQENVWDI